MNETLLARFETLTPREKIISLLTILVLTWAAWDQLIYSPLSQQQTQLDNQLSTLQTQLFTQQQAATQIETQGSIDPNQMNKEKLQTIKKQLNNLKQQLDFGDKKFVPASLMAEVLHDLLKKNHGLQLIKLETLPVSPLSAKKQTQALVFKHGLAISLSGHYFDTLHYLKSLESLPWRFNWESIEYQVTDYPIAETTLYVSTLSFEENWLGL